MRTTCAKSKMRVDAKALPIFARDCRRCPSCAAARRRFDSGCGVKACESVRQLAEAHKK